MRMPMNTQANENVIEVKKSIDGDDKFIYQLLHRFVNFIKKGVYTFYPIFY